jgi:Domain of unknown function (DUF4124)
MRATLLIFALLFASTEAQADKVYKWVDAQGNVLYTDQPRKGAREIKIAKQPPSAAPTTLASVQDDRSRYSAVMLVVPTNEDTIRDNAGDVKVAVNVVPSLRADLGDRIRLSLDGGALETDVSSSEVVLSGLDQGTHILQAVVTDKNGRVLASSDPVEIYLKHWSLLNPIGPGNYPATYPPQPYPPVYPKQVYTPVYPPSGAPKPRK